MAIYNTFFLARPDELLGGFPGWKSPLPVPVRRETFNMFIGEMVTIETREPEWPEVDEATLGTYEVVAGSGRYEDYLEDRLPAFVREKQHCTTKGLTNIELEALLGAIGINTELEQPIYAPPAAGAFVFGFPPEFATGLCAGDLDAVARRWAAAMSTPEHTHSLDGTKLSDGWTTDDAAHILTPIVSLADKAAARQRMYVLIET